MTNIDKKIEELRKKTYKKEVARQIVNNEMKISYLEYVDMNDVRQALLDIQKETAREKTCCCISYERGVTPCLCGCHKQLTVEDYE